MAQLDVPMPVEMSRNANQYRGSGTTDIWHRWGYVMHPMGYNWQGTQDQFASSAVPAGERDISSDGLGNSGYTDTGTTTFYRDGGNWDRRFDTLNLGILPIFHS